MLGPEKKYRSKVVEIVEIAVIGAVMQSDIREPVFVVR